MGVYLKTKRILDFMCAMLLSVVLVLPMVFIALVIKRQNDGPVFFKQVRPGKDGKPFTIYKVRTMTVETVRNNVPLSDMERITGVGAFLRKTSLDELPQLLNVLRGEMSFIGPRPLLVEYLELYDQRQMRRHEVLPGITGFAQVNGRNAITWKQKLEYDVVYVESASWRIDMKILAKTVINVITHEGVNSSDDVTVQKFMGYEEAN